ncbi:MAG: hypothetical protein HY738_03330 [Bacteroidia bacterium]|nr:hypothetical protein [Bacteroidia bacterium]
MTIVNIKKNDKTCIINYTGFIVRILLAIISINSYAQVNLVPNPGFENNTGCPSGENQLYLVNDWYAPTDGIPEYFHTCNIGWWGIPQNIDGYENTQKGEAYVGIYTFYLYFNYGCDYLQTELLDTLEHGNTYYVLRDYHIYLR